MKCPGKDSIYWKPMAIFEIEKSFLTKSGQEEARKVLLKEYK